MMKSMHSHSASGAFPNNLIADDGFEVIEKTECEIKEDDFNIIEKTECDIRDDYGVIEGAEVREQSALSRDGVAKWLFHRLGGHPTENGTCISMSNCITCHKMVMAIDFLFICNDEWNDPVRYLGESLECILKKLRALPAKEQRAFNDFLHKLLNNNWLEESKDLGIKSVFHIPAVVWAVRAGPRRIANGMVSGWSLLEFLEDVEDHWMTQHQEHPELDHIVFLLERFAKNLFVWEKEIAEPKRVLNGRGTRPTRKA